MTLVKICGITAPHEIAHCAAAGAHRLGFVVEYPVDVPWNLSRDQATALMSQVPAGVVRVAVVGGDADTIGAIIDHTHPDMVQLHGDESTEVVADLLRHGVPIIKALRIRANGPPIVADDLIARARAFVDAGAAEILLDTVTEGRPAGTGQTVDWSLAAAVRSAIDVPLVLAGGLNPGNVAQAVRQVVPFAVDVISGVEGPDHTKDPTKVDAFVQAVRSA